MATRQRLTERPLHGHGKLNHTNNVAFSPDGKLLSVIVAIVTVMVWDASTQKESGQPFQLQNVYVSGLEFSADSTVLATGYVQPDTRESGVKLW